MDFRQVFRATPLYDWLGKRSFAQSGEDLIAWGELGRKKRGYYIDIGAYHPKLFSNTYLFYKKGWRGICVEPNPEMAPLFRWLRPKDRFLKLGVGESKKLSYFQFEDSAANTFSEKQARKNIVEAGRKLKGKTLVPVMSLKTILEKYLPKGQKIDLLSVDVEGMDLEVLSSNDWKKYRPEVIIAEDLSFDFDNPRKSKIVNFLQGVGYNLVAKTPYSLIFKL